MQRFFGIQQVAVAKNTYGKLLLLVMINGLSQVVIVLGRGSVLCCIFQIGTGFLNLVTNVGFLLFKIQCQLLLLKLELANIIFIGDVTVFRRLKAVPLNVFY